MAKFNVRKLLKETLHPDTIGKSPATGSLMLRWEFFYRNGKTAEGYRRKVEECLKANGITYTIISDGEVWKPFRGGASTANQSHFYVEVFIDEVQS